MGGEKVASSKTIKKHNGSTLKSVGKVVSSAGKKAIDTTANVIQENVIPGIKTSASVSKDVMVNTVAPAVVSGSKQVVKATKKGAAVAKEKTVDTYHNLYNAMDVNGDGVVDIQDVILAGLNVPGVGINRSEFLRKEFQTKYSERIINDAIVNNPMHAGIPLEDIDKIADDVIEFERRNVSGISAALGAPGGVAMVATIPADIAQYYGFMIRTIQKLMYLYGWPQLSVEQAQYDSATMNTIIICLGAMYGVNGANKALKVLSVSLGKGVEKKLLNMALTKGTIYPIVKKVASWFSVSMTKKMFAGFFGKSIPVVGGVIGGGITYVSFKPCCDRLKKQLRETILANPAIDENDINLEDEIIDVDIK